MIIWLTGNSKSGKTSIGALLAHRNNGILLDGDEMRSSISLGAGFSKDEREKHNLRVARLAKVLENQCSPVVVAVIAPFQETRDKINEMICPIWIHLESRLRTVFDADRPYEVPTNACLSLDTDKIQIFDAVEKIESLLRLHRGRWHRHE